MEGTTWSGHNDSMEWISLGFSHLVGRVTSGVVVSGDKAVHSRATAKGANPESGSRMIGCFTITGFNFLLEELGLQYHTNLGLPLKMKGLASQVAVGWETGPGSQNHQCLRS
jgi:hypothetical protein